MKRPFGITVIGYFYLFGAFMLILTLFVDQEIALNVRFGVPFIPEIIVKISVAIISIVLAYGYLNLKKWGYGLIISYSVLFLAISLYQLVAHNGQPFLGNVIFSLIVLIYTYFKRKHFTGPQV